MGKNSVGFTLIELMIVVAIIGILAAIAIPKFAEMIRKSQEGSSKGNLGSLRSAMNIYYADNEGQFPSLIQSLTIGGRILSVIPNSKTPNYHADSSADWKKVVTGGGVLCVVVPPNEIDNGGWGYQQCEGVPVVNCSHTDSKGIIWTSY